MTCTVHTVFLNALQMYVHTYMYVCSNCVPFLFGNDHVRSLVQPLLLPLNVILRYISAHIRQDRNSLLTQKRYSEVMHVGMEKGSLKIIIMRISVNTK